MLKRKRITKAANKQKQKTKMQVLNEFKKKPRTIPPQQTELQIGQWLSSPDYMKIQFVDGYKIHVELPNQANQFITHDYLYEMHSSIHYDEVVELTRTEIVEKLITAKDKVFTAVFHKKLDPMIVLNKMKESQKSSFRNDKELTQLTKSVIEGDLCTISGRLNRSKQQLGRTLVVDLNATSNSQIRMIDHRTIECLIIDKKKYVTKTSKRLVENVGKQLQENENYTVEEGDWFSKTFYFKLAKIGSDCEFVNQLGEQYKISRSIVNNFMDNSLTYNEVVRVTRTEMVSILENVGDRAFTVCFNKKIDDKVVREKLKKIDLRRLTNEAYMLNLAEEILTGEESTITGHLLKSETLMGRSAVINLNAERQPAYRQIDHRTIKELITGNKRYILK